MNEAETSHETRLYAWLQAACCLLATGITIASYSPGSGLLAVTTRTASVQARLEIVLVDDAVDPMAGHAATLPERATMLAEMTAITGDPVRHHYVRLVLGEGESFRLGLARLQPWLKTLDLPAGDRLAWQHETPGDYHTGFDDDGPTANLDDFRSYLVRAIPLASAPDVKSVELTINSDGYASTTLRLDSAAARRLSEGTGRHIHGRMAILVNGFVTTAAVIQQPIDNGTLQISPGGDTPEETKKRAEKLLKELTTPPPR